jgi:hypothetical protein
MVSNLALFCLATYLATFQKIGQFFLYHLVTLFVTNKPFQPSLMFVCKAGAYPIDQAFWCSTLV